MLSLHVCSLKRIAIANKIHLGQEWRLERTGTTSFMAARGVEDTPGQGRGSSEKKNAGVLGLSRHNHTLSPSLAVGELPAIWRHSLAFMAGFRHLHP